MVGPTRDGVGYSPLPVPVDISLLPLSLFVDPFR